MPVGQPADGRAPARRDVGSMARATDRSIEQLDRRLSRPQRTDWLYTGPDSPGLNSGKAWLRPRRDDSSDAGGGGPGGTVTILGNALILPFDSTANPSAPTATVLPDSTTLLAWIDYDTATTHLQHRTRDLATVISETTMPDGGDYGLTLATVDGTTVLATGGAAGGSIHTVTTNPLTVGPGVPYAHPVQWLRTRSTATVDGAALIGAGSDLIRLTPTGLTATAVPGDITGVHPDGPTLSLDTGSTTTLSTPTGAHIATGPTLPWAWTPYPAAATTDGWAWPAMTYAPTGDTLAVHDQTGAVTNNPHWPTTARRQTGLVGMAATPNGTLLAIPHIEDGTGRRPGRITLAHVDRAGSITIIDDLMTDAPGFDTTVYAESPTIATDGRTAVIAASFIEYTLDSNVGTRAWTVDLGAATGVLDVPTLDGWWTVGTQDGGMAHELLVPTPLGWWVEVVAGEAHDSELCVPDPLHPDAGDDGWVVVALMRPDMM